MNATPRWIQRVIALTAMGFVLVNMTTARPASADASAVAFLAPYVSWAQSQPNGPGTYALSVVMVSNEPNQVASYAENDVLPFGDAWVWRVGSTGVIGLVHVQGFDSDPTGTDATQYFSDRRYSLVPPPAFITYPFSASKTDVLGINVDTLAGSLTLTLKSWGSALETADLHAANGVLIGTLNTKDPTTVVLSVKKIYFPPPPPIK